MDPGLVSEAREAYRGGEWSRALALFEEVDARDGLSPSDLELLADARFMRGDVLGMIDGLERAHQGYLDAGDTLDAGRTAGWLAANFGVAGKWAQANGWLERAHRVMEGVDDDCVERGYLLLHPMIQDLDKGEEAAVLPLAERATDLGTRFGSPDLVALAGHLWGRSLIAQGRIGEAIGVLDETMISVTTGRVSPRVTGIVYCGVVECCFLANEIERATEWTEALSGWVDSQPDLVAFTELCLAHRSEILRLHGSWDDALAEARRACEQDVRGVVAGLASYQEAEIHRLRGEYDLAEESYRTVGLQGKDPQPGLALLRLAQGSIDAATASIARAVAETDDQASRARLLAAQIEVAIQGGDLIGAEAAAAELSAIAEETRVEMHLAWAASGRGRVELAARRHQQALSHLRESARRWQELNVPYETARSRLDLANALSALDDTEAADMEMEAARAVFAGLGAAPDMRRVDELRAGTAPARPNGLTGREVEVLRLVSTGASNRAIAEALVLSERTIDRHVSNIYAKIGVSSRAAATAYALRHRLV